MIIQIRDGAPINHPIKESNFKQLFPNTSFPRYLSPADVEPFGYGAYEYSAAPEPARYQKVVEVSPVKDNKGVWRQTWELVDMTTEERAAADAEQAVSVRAARDHLLTECDWIVTKAVEQNAADNLGVQIPQVWTTYREALREIPSQPGFPWDVSFPDQPE